MTVHTTFPKGVKVHLIRNDGKHFVGKYVEKKSRFVVLEVDRVTMKFPISDIRSASIER